MASCKSANQPCVARRPRLQRSLSQALVGTPPPSRLRLSTSQLQLLHPSKLFAGHGGRQGKEDTWLSKPLTETTDVALRVHQNSLYRTVTLTPREIKNDESGSLLIQNPCSVVYFYLLPFLLPQHPSRPRSSRNDVDSRHLWHVAWMSPSSVGQQGSIPNLPRLAKYHTVATQVRRTTHERPDRQTR